jgi:hypothetical protein
MRMSKERKPIWIVPARAVADIRRAKQINTHIRGFMNTSLHSSGPGLTGSGKLPIFPQP